MSAATRRVSLEPAYLLHHHPWRDSSRILELLTHGHGRHTVFARAARRSSSGWAGLLQPFTGLLVSWSGRGEAGQLTAVERSEPPRQLAGDRLMSGFYANELLMRLLARGDAQPEIYREYQRLLLALGDPSAEIARPLRLFEKRLLEHLGWGLSLGSDASHGAPLDPGCSYRYRLDGGAERLDGVAEGSLVFSGASLVSLAREELRDPRSLADARRLLRAALDQALEGRALRTRDVLMAMRLHGDAAEGG
ncbi:MAG TPA: DNA repair protein RecO [Steroidobacteraceae bacterium]|nr:DNA repair protein RecO [Steroidobacteraceae bacterium]